MKRVAMIALAAFLTGCATPAKTSGRVRIGMTQGQVLRACGEPYFRTADDPASEEWHYRGTVWDNGRWSWDRTSQTTRIVFYRGRVSSIGDSGESHRSGLRSDFVNGTPVPR